MESYGGLELEWRAAAGRKAGPNQLLPGHMVQNSGFCCCCYQLVSPEVPASSLHCLVYESRGPGLPEQLNTTATTHCCQHVLICRVWRTLSGPHPSPSCLTAASQPALSGLPAVWHGSQYWRSSRAIDTRDGGQGCSTKRYCSTSPPLFPQLSSPLTGTNCLAGPAVCGLAWLGGPHWRQARGLHASG